MWIDENGTLYQGDLIPGDREATEQEYLEWKARHDLLKANSESDAQAKENVKADSVIQYLINHTPAECALKVDEDVTNLATAKVMLEKFAMALCVLAKQSLR